MALVSIHRPILVILTSLFVSTQRPASIKGRDLRTSHGFLDGHTANRVYCHTR
jgi:hypothetical protein